jgi:uncharacterized protein (DUF2062 family)
MRIYEKFKKFFLIHDTPHKIAGGAALGIFLGILPGGFLSAIILSYIFRVNRLAAIAGVAITNFWSTPLAVLPAAAIGGFLSGENPQILIENFKANFHIGYRSFFTETVIFNLLLPLTVGFFIFAGIIAFAFYLLILYLLKNNKIKFK